MPGWRSGAAARAFQFFPGEEGAGMPTVDTAGTFTRFNFPNIYFDSDSYFRGHTDRWWREYHNPFLQLYDDPRDGFAHMRYLNNGAGGQVLVSPRTWRDPQLFMEYAAGGALFQQSLIAVAVGVAGLSDAVIFPRTLSATAIGVATISDVIIFRKTLPATAVGVAILTRVTTFRRTLAATAVGATTIIKKVRKTLAATAVGAANLSRVATYPKTLSATAVGVATIARAKIIPKTLSAIALGIANITTLFIPGAPGAVRKLRWWMRRNRSRKARGGR